MNKDLMFSSKTDDWATPIKFFEELDIEFGFTLDPCASEKNAKCKKYFTKEQDGLSMAWGGGSILQSSLRQGNIQMGKEML